MYIDLQNIPSNKFIYSFIKSKKRFYTDLRYATDISYNNM